MDRIQVILKRSIPKWKIIYINNRFLNLVYSKNKIFLKKKN